ncbi:hypothetical protein KCP71_18105 [Salmonella enterica subsp. enterica]|nr:hypothetical protein KCP71_18105 [Salmonella enterica subsp. enterica]
MIATTRTCIPRRKQTSADRASRSLITGQRMDKITSSGPNWEEILGGEFEKRARPELQLCRRRCTASSKTPSHDVPAAPV